MGQQGSNVINMNGGLDLISTYYSHQAQPGTCSEMVNYEPSINAGYRRINGWSEWGTATPTGATDDILGIMPYADGVLAVAGTGLYFSTDGITWSQVNRDTYVAQTDTVTVGASPFTAVTADVAGAFTTEYEVGDHIKINGEIRQIASITDDDNLTVESGFSAAHAAQAHYKNGNTALTGSLSARTSQGRTMFALIPSDGEYGSVAFSDESGNNDLGWFKITGTGGSRTYYYDTLSAADFAAPTKPKYVTYFEERIIAYNDDSNVGRLSYGERLSKKRFDGASAGTIAINSPIIHSAALRDKLIIFTKDEIHQLVNIDDSSNIAIQPISYNIGCVSGWSVQEMGGDLIFLAEDGIRKLAASDTYGDVQFGNLARLIDPLVKDIVDNAASYTFSSGVFKTKNQYRLFYTVDGADASTQKGISGTLKLDNAGQLVWQWNELHGMDISCMAKTDDSPASVSLSEQFYHGQFDGKVCLHDSGSDYDGSAIEAHFKLNELDYGDIGRRKTLHYVRVFGELESTDPDQISMKLEYDFFDGGTAQPEAYQLATSSGSSYFGTGTYGTATFGGGDRWNQRVLVEGSGYSNSFKFSTSGTNGPFSINSLYVDMRAGPLL